MNRLGHGNRLERYPFDFSVQTTFVRTTFARFHSICPVRHRPVSRCRICRLVRDGTERSLTIRDDTRRLLSQHAVDFRRWTCARCDGMHGDGDGSM